MICSRVLKPVVSRAVTSVSTVRSLSSQAGALTPEDIEKGIEKVDRYRKFVQKSSQNRMLEGLGSGEDLYLPEDITEMTALSCMPEVHSNRTVLIQPRVLKSLQSGDSGAHHWTLTWKNQERWTNPLMGYTSSADPMAQVRLVFDSREEAVAYAERNGWKHECMGDTSKTNRVPGYTHYKHNFLDKRTMAILKRDGDSNTDGIVRQHGPAASSASSDTASSKQKQ
eukprot:CAMPEP_0181290684 /NCGR_PEP_ID=MMETSP1101-20121128/1546_1 /TAXON_ID=46948 /ORGANISM="Rhodomonas abbreviata, Strain Caron Lab Isolate" /LENGTH=224 /DNA_ID=CAMNT_0023394987 /DNA_START=1 /DNA_END=675 /DNA_ORIENTATION=+